MTIRANELARVNVRSVANSKGARKETRAGREVMVVPSATLPDNVIMNGVRYPADEIEKSYKTLERTPAPLGHPTVNGGWVSASDPEGINIGWIGAYNENVRREGGRVLLDKVIDIEVANRSEGGRSVLAAIEAGDPIHTSTGLYLKLNDVKDDDTEAMFNASDMIFDHDAILIDEKGAATPDQGVGMLVNKGKEISVINSRIDWAEENLEWAAEAVMDAAERLDKAKKRESLIPRLLAFLKGEQSTAENVQEEIEMDKEELEKLNGRINAIETKVDGFADTIKNAIGEALKPVVDAQTEAANKAKEAEESRREELTNTIVNAGLREAEECAELSVNRLSKIAESIKDKPSSQGLNRGTPDPKGRGYQLPKGDK